MGSPAGSSSSISITGGRATFRHGTGSTPTPSPRPRLVKSNTSSPASSTTNNNNGRFMSISRDENDAAGEVTSEFNPSYTVHIPPTPDHHLNLSSAAPLHPRNPNTPVPGKSAAGNGKGKLEQQEQQQQLQQEEEKFLSSVLFTGGFDSVTRGHVMEKGMEDDGAGDSSNRQTPISSSFTSRGRAVCSIRGCDAKSLDLIPCECRYRICRDCYIDALDAKGARCPGCKEPYKIVDPEDEHLPLPPAPTVSECRAERRLSLLGTMKSSKSTTQLLMSNHGGDFDHTGWLYGTKGTYGYGNALWPKDGAYIGTGGIHGSGGNPSVLNERSRKPLSRKISISPAVLNPYRLLVLIRLAALVMFLMWRIKRPNRDAMWLWGMSVVCEMWFAFSWILDQLPKLNPVNRTADLNMLRERFEMPSVENPRGRSDLPGVDVFVSTADAEKEPPLVTANTILSILAAEYPVDKTAVYLSDDAGSLLSFEALAEAGSFARIWVPFCRKHSIEPRNPESYFQLRGDPTKNKVRPDFVKDRRRVKREYDEFKVRINGLPDSIRRRSGAYNAHEEMRAKRSQVESGGDVGEPSRALKATWMSDGTHWPGTWTSSEKDHARGDHAGIIQVMLAPPGSEQMLGNNDEDNLLDTTDVDIRLPMLVYVSREKRPGYDHNKKAGAMNALVRTSAVMSNGAFVLNLDCDHYINNSMALREAMCFLMDRGGDRVCFVQFPQRFEGVDPNDRYANHNTVFFDVNMRALDGLQGPMYVGTGCVFRRFAIYGFDPPRVTEHGSYGGCCGSKRKFFLKRKGGKGGRMSSDEDEDEVESQLLPKKFGNSAMLLASIPVAEFQGRPLAEQAGVKNGRPAGALTLPREPLDSATVAEAINVISCWYEDKTEWGQNVGWIYGSVTEDVVTGYRMHNKGWKSVYCVTACDAFRGTAPINLTDRLHQVLRWATGSVEIFFSRNNAIFGSSRLKLLQRIAYMNVGIYPFTSIFLTVYCFLPALSLFTGHFIVQSVSISFLVLLLIITVTLCMLAVLEIKWSGITLEEWWRNEQFWLIGGTSAHMAAVLQGLLKVIAGVDISFTLTAKASSGDENEDDYAELYEVRWSALMIPPITIMMINIIAIIVGVARTIYSPFPQWTTLIGSAFFSMWVLFHLYPFAKGLMGRKRRTPTIIYVWSGLLAIVISLLWVSISNPLPSNNSNAIQGFQFP